MKYYLLLIALIATSFSLITPKSDTELGKETLIDMIERAEFIPVYFVTKEVLYDHTITKTTSNEVKTFVTCGKVDEKVALTDDYNSSYEAVVAELNRVFKTDKFVMKPNTDIPATAKQGGGAMGMMGGAVASAVTPPLKGFEFSGVSSPFFVLCSIGGFYQGDGLFETDGIKKMDNMKYKNADVKVSKEINVSMKGFANARFLSYDPKKKKVTYADSQAIYAESDGGSFVQTQCFSAIGDLTAQLDPASGAVELTSSINGMFDGFAGKHWKKQK
jgi:hypothetical protein